MSAEDRFAAIADCPENVGFSYECPEYGLCRMKAQKNPTRKAVLAFLAASWSGDTDRLYARI
jgi:hypothetical protein